MFFYLMLSIYIFIIGIFGVFLSRKDLMMMLISFELMLLSMNINFILFSVFLDDILGQMYALLILTVAASETSLGLAILMVYYSLRGCIYINLLSLLKA